MNSLDNSALEGCLSVWRTIEPLIQESSDEMSSCPRWERVDWSVWGMASVVEVWVMTEWTHKQPKWRSSGWGRSSDLWGEPPLFRGDVLERWHLWDPSSSSSPPRNQKGLEKATRLDLTIYETHLKSGLVDWGWMQRNDAAAASSSFSRRLTTGSTPLWDPNVDLSQLVIIPVMKHDLLNGALKYSI